MRFLLTTSGLTDSKPFKTTGSRPGNSATRRSCPHGLDIALQRRKHEVMPFFDPRDVLLPYVERFCESFLREGHCPPKIPEGRFFSD